MASVYILYSKQLDRFYIGSCDNITIRLEQHANKTFKSSFTSKADDWDLYFLLDDLQYHQVRAIELHIKKMHSSKYIKNLKLYPEMIEKLIKKYS